MTARPVGPSSSTYSGIFCLSVYWVSVTLGSQPRFSPTQPIGESDAPRLTIVVIRLSVVVEARGRERFVQPRDERSAWAAISSAQGE
jgi:hypothetical protein